MDVMHHIGSSPQHKVLMSDDYHWYGGFRGNARDRSPDKLIDHDIPHHQECGLFELF
jgi:hypothetical protein